MKVRVKGIDIFALSGHNDDEPILGDAPQLSDCGLYIQYVFEYVSANNRVKSVICKWQ